MIANKLETEKNQKASPSSSTLAQFPENPVMRSMVIFRETQADQNAISGWYSD